MRIFLTGATGFIGSAIVPELIQAGHQVLGVTRSDSGAKALTAAGAEVFRGTLEDPAGLAAGAAQCDGVIHCAFDHDFSNFVANCEKDRRVIEALGDALVGTSKPLVITSGIGLGIPDHGGLAMENIYNPEHPNPRKLSEVAGQAVAAKGVNVSVVRLPQVHDPVKQGLITPLLEMARAKGSVAYVGDGANRWPAAHVSDVARLYRLAVEKAEAGSRYNAVAEEGIPAKEIVEALARGLKMEAVSATPEQAPQWYGWMAGFVGMDMPASSAQTQAALGWKPTGPGLIADLEAMKY